MVNVDQEVKENIEAWIAALRSGKYRQGLYGLRRADGASYCVLGVACELSPLATSREGYNGYNINGNYHNSTVPHNLAESFGLNTATMCAVVGLNDTGRLNFDQLANWIEINVLKMPWYKRLWRFCKSKCLPTGA